MDRDDLLTTGWIVLGSFVAIFPGVLEKIFGVAVQLRGHWGLCAREVRGSTPSARSRMIVAFGVVGYLFGGAVRRDLVAAGPELPVARDAGR